jgi:hypothetical protein
VTAFTDLPLSAAEIDRVVFKIRSSGPAALGFCTSAYRSEHDSEGNRLGCSSGSFASITTADFQVDGKSRPEDGPCLPVFNPNVAYTDYTVELNLKQKTCAISPCANDNSTVFRSVDVSQPLFFAVSVGGSASVRLQSCYVYFEGEQLTNRHHVAPSTWNQVQLFKRKVLAEVQQTPTCVLNIAIYGNGISLLLLSSLCYSLCIFSSVFLLFSVVHPN